MATEWCYSCELGHAEFDTQTREQVGAFSTQTFVQKLCLDCLCEKWKNVGMKETWGMKYRRIGTNGMWNKRGEM